jgi:hypothetical protein
MEWLAEEVGQEEKHSQDNSRLDQYLQLGPVVGALLILLVNDGG